MKKIIFITILAFCFLGCTSNKVEDDVINNNQSCCKKVYLSDTGLLKVKEEKLVTGLLLDSGDEKYEYTLYENYNSRSRISYNIIKEGSDKSSYDLLEELKGKDITVSYELINDYSIWDKEITISSVTVREELYRY